MHACTTEDPSTFARVRPFLKWAGGKRWLADSPHFAIPKYTGRYIEPFLGSGAIYFHHKPRSAVLSDVNPMLIESYRAIRDNPQLVRRYLCSYQRRHSTDFYYSERATSRRSMYTRAAQFIYLNRTCWNGLYRENLEGAFNVPIGTKSKIVDPDEDLKLISSILSGAKLLCQDFGRTVAAARKGDFIFADPPYTTAHNNNGFVKYNQRIFSWEDQVRLRDMLFAARKRGAHVVVTNAHHDSIIDLYADSREMFALDRGSVISGVSAGRKATSELVISV